MGRDMCYWVELWLRLGVVGGFFHSLFRDLPGSRNSRLVFFGVFFFSTSKMTHRATVRDSRRSEGTEMM